jgi:branched-chain amino acid transport system substrate-binding protein
MSEKTTGKEVSRRNFVKYVGVGAVALAAGAAGTYLATQSGRPSTTGTANVQPIKIGVILPLTGSLALSGQDLKAGYDYAVEEINALGGIQSLGGARLELVYGDSTGDPSVGVRETQRLITEENVKLLTGTMQSGVILACMPVAEKSQIPFVVSIGSSDSLTEQGYKYFFRPGATNQCQAVEGAQLLKDLLTQGKPIKTIAYLYENSEFGTNWIQGFKKDMVDLGVNLDVVAEVPYQFQTPDVTTEIAKLKAANPDILYGISYILDGILIRRTMKSAGWKPKLFMQMSAPDETAYIDTLQDDANGVVCVGTYTPDIKTFYNPTFVNNWRHKYGMDPSAFIASAYTVTWAMYDALQRAASYDTTKIRDALAATDITPSSTGLSTHALVDPFVDNEIKYDQNGQAPFLGVAYQIQNLQRRVIAPAEFASAQLQFPW